MCPIYPQDQFWQLGVSVEAGAISFKPSLLEKQESLDQPAKFSYIDVTGARQTVDLPAGSLAFTFCQVPVIYCSGPEEKISVQFADGSRSELAGSCLGLEISQSIFRREGKLKQVTVYRS